MGFRVRVPDPAFAEIREKGMNTMKLMNVRDVDSFFAVVDSCKGKVELISKEGDCLNLKSTLTQYVALAKMISNGYIQEMELIIHEPEDVVKFLEFAMNGNTK